MKCVPKSESRVQNQAPKVAAMRVRRVRFTVRTMMVLVALLGVSCLVGREYWTRWGRRSTFMWVYGSHLSTSAGPRNELSFSPGQSVPVVITYNFKFGTAKPAPGTACLLFAEVWFEEVATGVAVDCYSFDAPLTVGGREAASGSLTWDAILPRPGRYYLRHFLHFTGPTGDLQGLEGAGKLYNVVPAPPSSPPPGRSGPNP
jgi:hypothetical protein